jgi:hypothetical protein
MNLGTDKPMDAMTLGKTASQIALVVEGAAGQILV